MIITDTNVLLRAALDDDPEQSRVARKCLGEAQQIAIPLHAFCEFVWVLSRSYRLESSRIATSVMALINDEKVSCQRDAVAAGLVFLLDGGDFADGVIEFEGRRLGGETFTTFDKCAASIICAKGRECTVLDGD